MKKLLFVYNPRAGKEMLKPRLSDVLDIFVKAGYEVTVHPTQAYRDAYYQIKEYEVGKYDLIACSGGDGTIDEVATGMMKRREMGKDVVPVGYIPAGTTNDFAKSLHIPRKPLAAADNAVKGVPFPCDIGKFNDSVFVDAEVNYRKALEVNPKSTVSMYNLGNTLSQQQKFQDAMEQYVAAGKIEKDKMKLAHIYHNMGVLFQAGKDYAKAVEAYKMSLRNNPADDETRYNLALAQKMLKDQQQNQDQNQDQNKDQQQKQDQQQDKNKDKQNDQKQDEKKDQQQPPKSEKKDNQMSKENAEQLLNSVMQDEKDVQDKVKKQQKVLQGGRLEKDW